MGIQVPGKYPAGTCPKFPTNFLTCKAVTIYTFFVLVLFRRPAEYISIIVIAAIWICTGLVVALPLIVHKPEVYYGNTDFCMTLYSSH